MSKSRVSWKDWLMPPVLFPVSLVALIVIYALVRAPAQTLNSHAPSRSTLDAFQRLFYAAREKANVDKGSAVRFVATMNGDTLRQLGREVAMGGVVALLGLPAACERAAALANGPTDIILWDVELVLDSSLGDSELRMTAASSTDGPAEP